MKDYYEILEIEKNSNIDEIKQAYRRLAKKYHPDASNNPKTAERFIEITEAYEMLLLHSSPAKEEREKQQTENYEEFINEIRKAAQRQAQMKYEKYVRENEAFRESGWYDVQLLFKYILRAIAPFFGFVLIFLPFLIAIEEKSVAPIFYLFVTWVIGGFIIYDAYEKRNNYFKLGEFYYSFQRIKSLYAPKNIETSEKCFYCKGHSANSRTYNIILYKVKKIGLDNQGPLNHKASFKRNEIRIRIPRSQKAYVVHSLTTLVKLITIIAGVIVLPFNSIIWRIIVGSFAGWFLSSAVLWSTHTRSKSGFLFSYGVLIKILFWLGGLSLVSSFYFNPLNICTSDFIQFSIFVMVVLDSFLEQILKLPTYFKLFRPILKQYKNLDKYFDDNYQLYLEIPVWTTLFPYFRWIF